MSDHHRRLNLLCLVRMYRDLNIELPEDVIAELAAAGIDPESAEVLSPDFVQGSGRIVPTA